MVISSSLSQQIFQALPRSLGPFFTSSTQPSCPLAMNDKPPTRTHIYSKLNGNFFVPGIGRPIDLPRIDNVPVDYPNIKYFYFSKNGHFYRPWLPWYDFYWTVEVKRGLCDFDDCIMLVRYCQPASHWYSQHHARISHLSAHGKLGLIVRSEYLMWKWL